MIRWLILLFIILFSWPCFGLEIYEYRDEHGRAIFTYDPQSIPKHLKKGVIIHDLTEEEVISDEPDLPDKGSERIDETKSLELKDIKVMAVELEEEYRRLLEEKKALNRMAESAESEKEKETVAVRVDALNRRIMEYEKKRKAFNAMVEDYNRRIEGKRR